MSEKKQKSQKGVEKVVASLVGEEAGLEDVISEEVMEFVEEMEGKDGGTLSKVEDTTSASATDVNSKGAVAVKKKHKEAGHKRSKRLRARDHGIDFKKEYSASDALLLLKERASAKFDETVEVVFSCNIDTKKGDQSIRAMVSLPFGVGREKRVAVFATGDQGKRAKEAGADHVGGLELVERVQGGFMEFDVCIADPEMMPHLAKLGRVLGPRSLMPNPKLGTVTTDVAGAVQRAKKGQASLRGDKQGLVHTVMGKMSFPQEALLENFHTLCVALLALKPENTKTKGHHHKGNFIKSLVFSSTMGFGIKVMVSEMEG